MIIDAYIQALRDDDASPNTIRLRRIYVMQLAAAHPLLTATTTDLREWLDGHDWAPYTVNAATASLRSFYSWAEETNHVTENPARRLKYVRIRNHHAHRATAEQIARGLASEDPSIRAMTRLGAENGLRVSEIARFRTTNLDGDAITLTGKGRVVRTVYASPELLADLALLTPSEDGWYFPGNADGHMSTDVVRRRIRHALDTNPHSLRHRAGTTVYRDTGNNLRIAQVFLGHASPATTAIYVHVTEDDLRAALAAARIAA